MTQLADKWLIDYLEECVVDGEFDPRPDWLKQLVGSSNTNLYPFLYVFMRHAEKIRRVLEIGCACGTSAAHFAIAEHRVVSVDVNPHATRMTQTLARERGLLINTITGDSHAVVDVVQAFAPYDVLLIDGCHEEEHACEDFRLYEPMVASGGVIFCDDIDMSAGMKRFWASLPQKKQKFTLRVHEEWGFGCILK